MLQFRCKIKKIKKIPILDASEKSYLEMQIGCKINVWFHLITKANLGISSIKKSVFAFVCIWC